jgi:disulfide bond formation protein DsbB
MSHWYQRIRYYGLAVAAGTLLAFNGCGLSDQQWASIWQSVISSGLNTIVTSALSNALSGTGQV